jgi:hypothetical protein
VGLRDVTGVFSRFFVVGFFVPGFVATFAVAALFADAGANTDTRPSSWAASPRSRWPPRGRPPAQPLELADAE